MEEFKIGDLIEIKSWEELVVEFGINGDDEILCDAGFFDGMKYLCGQKFVIREIHDDNTYKTIQDIDDWTISFDMIKYPEERNNIMKFKYKNWKEETRDREVTPIHIWYGQTDYHKENQWLLKAKDIEDENKVKNFAMSDIIEIYK